MSDLKNNEDLLSDYMLKLDEVFNLSYNELDKTKEFSFKLHKEKTFEYLNKAEQLNNSINSSIKNSNENDLNNSKDIIDIVDKYQANRQFKLRNIINLNKHFELSISLIKQKCKLNVTNLNFFVGLDEFKAYLHNSLDKFCLNESLANKNLIKLENSKFANNSLIYGMNGCGRMSLLICTLIKKGLIEIIDEKISSTHLKLFIIDFNLIFKNQPVEKSLFESIMKSIYLLIDETKLSALVVLKNLEILFEKETNESNLDETKLRFIGDLLYELDNGLNQTGSHHNIYRANIMFVLFCNAPWLIHPSVLYHFDHKIYCSFLNNTQIKVLLNSLFERWSENEFEKEWAMNNFLDYYKKSNLVDILVSDCLNNKLITGKLLNNLVEYLGNELNSFIKNEFKKLVKIKGLAWENDYVNKFELFLDVENFKLKKKFNDGRNKNWKSLKNKLSVIQKFNSSVKNSFMSVNNRKSSSQEQALLNKNENKTKDTILFNSIKNSIWNDSENLNKHLIVKTSEFVNLDVNVIDKKGDLIEKYELFKKEFNQ